MMGNNNDIKKKNKLNVNEISSVSGGLDSNKELKNEKQVQSNSIISEILATSGTPVGVSIDDACHKKEGTFKALNKQNVNEHKCRNCWHLKFSNGFYCDA